MSKIIDAACTREHAVIVAMDMPPLMVYVENGQYKAKLLKIDLDGDVPIFEEVK